MKKLSLEAQKLGQNQAEVTDITSFGVEKFGDLKSGECVGMKACREEPTDTRNENGTQILGSFVDVSLGLNSFDLVLDKTAVGIRTEWLLVLFDELRAEKFVEM